MEFNLTELTGNLERIIRNSISSISSHEWNEDFITLSLLRDLRKGLLGTTLIGRDSKNSISWQVYKLRGTYENNFGDIALAINIKYKDSTDISGVAFLEAKKRDWRKTTFGAMRMPQAKKILKNAPRAQYLLYDYEEITKFLYGSLYSEELIHYRHERDIKRRLSEVTRAVCVPLNLALATGYKDMLLYRNGLPLSLMLSNRYFQGLDLEFDETSKQVATGFLNKFGLPKYIVKIDILEIGAEPGEQGLQINQLEYSAID